MSLYDKASLLLIPSGTKTSRVYSQKPVSGDGDFTFTRSSAATRVNADGNIEKETQNLLLQSNTFDTTWVNELGGTPVLTGGQAGYDGTNDAWLVGKGAEQFKRIKQSVSASGVWTYSVYAKANTQDSINLRDETNNKRCEFDLTNGVISFKQNEIDARMVSVGGGWYRCSVTFNQSTSSLQIYIGWSDFDAGTVYLQDAQLEYGLVARDVITTTTTAVEGGITDNVPRLDYTDSSCPALLLEPQRTNLVPISEGVPEDFGSVTLIENYGTSPEGVQNSLKVQKQGVNANDRIEVIDGYNATLVSGNDYTISAFVKNIDVTGVTTIACRVSGGTLFRQPYQWSGASLTTATHNQGGTRTNTILEDYGNGWWRIGFTFEADGTSGNFELDIDRYNGSDTTSIETWGWQLEAGTYATSYIPTYGSSVTRVVDDCDAVSATSLIGQSEGTLFLDFVANDDDALQIIYQVRTTGSTNVSQVDFRIQSGNLRALGNDAGTTQFNISAGAAVAGTRYKCAVRYANNNVAFYVNGVLKGSDTSASFSSSSLDQITFNENGNNFYPSVNVNQALIIPTALTNTELADLTTL
jgi:hypothetical protein